MVGVCEGGERGGGGGSGRVVFIVDVGAAAVIGCCRLQLVLWHLDECRVWQLRHVVVHVHGSADMNRA